MRHKLSDLNIIEQTKKVLILGEIQMQRTADLQCTKYLCKN